MQSTFLITLFALTLLSVRLRAEEAPRKVVLTDGVRLILKPETTTDNVAITLFVRVPPDKTERENAAGELVAHAFLYGNENSSFDSIADAVHYVSGGLEIVRTADIVAVRIVTDASRLNDAAHLLAQALKNANFGPDALDRARRDVFAAQVPRPGRPLYNLLETLRASFRPFPPPDGSLMRRVTPQAAQDYFHERYTADRTVITLVGNFAPKQAISAFDNNFFDFANVPKRPIMQALTGNSTAFDLPPLRVTTPGAAAYALLAVAAPTPDSPDYPAFLTLNALLGAGHASRLFQNIRDTQGFGYEVNSAYYPAAPELWTAYLQWDAARTLPPDAALKLLQTQISGVIANPPNETELQHARALAVGQTGLRRESPREESYLLGWYEAMGAGYNFDSALPRAIEAVTRDDIARAAKRYFARRAALIALPAK